MAQLTHRAKRRARALALQIFSAGKFHPCGCGDPGCFLRRTRKTIADKIIKGQMKTLRLDQATIDAALRQVSIIDD